MVVVGAAVVNDAVVVVVVVVKKEEEPVNRAGENNVNRKRITVKVCRMCAPEISSSGRVKPLINHLMNNLKLLNPFTLLLSLH